ncbi:hypothetical protein BH11BAC3_BH11BAC3_36300 [soil metagenome]
MDEFSTLVFRNLVDHFPDFAERNDQATKHLELNISSPTDTHIGGLVIQTTVDENIWLRNYHPYSAYSVDNTEQLINLMQLKNPPPLAVVMS